MGNHSLLYFLTVLDCHTSVITSTYLGGGHGQVPGDHGHGVEAGHAGGQAGHVGGIPQMLTVHFVLTLWSLNEN